MTVPVQRTRAVVNTERFLVALSSGEIKRIPKAIREHAFTLLRHYPTPLDMEQAAQRMPETFGPVPEVQKRLKGGTPCTSN